MRSERKVRSAFGMQNAECEFCDSLELINKFTKK